MSEWPEVERREGAYKEREQIRAVFWVVGIGALIMLIVTTVLSTAALSIAGDVRDNSNQIGQTANRIETVERKDTIALRGASYRTCEREQRDRAEQHLRAGLSPPAAVARLVHQLGLPPNLAEQVSIEAVRKRLPIFDCTPNLVGGQARPLTTKEQSDYVRRYASGQLDPTP